jgi:CheY-like chemotaxis protein
MELAPMKLRPLVLIVEHSDDMRDRLATVLRLEGFVVEEARDGREGIEKAVTYLPDIILTDLAMPLMNGWEMIKRLRRDHRTRHIPIIACRRPARGAPDLLVEVRRLLRAAA